MRARVHGWMYARVYAWAHTRPCGTDMGANEFLIEEKRNALQGSLSRLFATEKATVSKAVYASSDGSGGSFHGVILLQVNGYLFVRGNGGAELQQQADNIDLCG